jgi:hypothetical protein
MCASFFHLSALFDTLERTAHVLLNSARIEAGDGVPSLLIHTQLLIEILRGKFQTGVWGHQYIETNVETSNLARTA